MEQNSYEGLGTAGNLANAFGTGLGRGLRALAQNKLNDIQQQKETMLFQNAGYDPETAKLLSHLGRQSPNQLHNILGMLQSGQGQDQQQAVPGQPEQMGMPQQGTQEIAPTKPLNFAQQIAKHNEVKKVSPVDDFKKEIQLAKQEAAQEKEFEKLSPSIENIKDIKRITKRMKELLQSGKVNVGNIASAKSKYLGPNWNSEETEDYEKLANELLILTSDSAKGVQNVFRTKLRQNAKPGLAHSLKINERIVDDIYDQASQKEKSFFLRHPKMMSFFPEDMPDLPDITKYPAGSKIRDKITGSTFVSNGSDWEKINE